METIVGLVIILFGITAMYIISEVKENERNNLTHYGGIHGVYDDRDDKLNGRR